MLNISISPHIHSKDSVKRSMWAVNMALLPALIASFYFFGPRAFWLELISIGTAVVCEAVMQILLGRRVTVYDGSAILTGLLVAFNMPPGVPFYVPVIGTAFAIIIVKHLFGGLGNNIFNPALAGRVFVMYAWLQDMTTWHLPLDFSWLEQFRLFHFDMDTVTAATPLAVNKLSGMKVLVQQFGSKAALYKNLFIGRVGGCIGETSALALLTGGVYMIIRRIINPLIPFLYISVVFVLTAVFGQDPVFHILAGGLFLGAFFMATDYVSSPLTITGTIIYAVGCGLITVLIRLKGGLPEGVSFSILLMNALVPLIDRYTRLKTYGKQKVSKKSNKG